MSPDAITETRTLGIKMIRYLEGLPRPQRWQETRHFSLSMNKNASYLDAKFIEQLKGERAALKNDLTGGGKHGQFLLSMPDFVFAAVTAVDPTLKEELDSRDRAVADKAWKKLANAFPMYKIPRGSL